MKTKAYDVHTQKAVEIFKVPAEQVTSEQRRFAKTQNYFEMYRSPTPMRFSFPHLKDVK